ncbi:hypothetical protein FRC12_007275 [Ceratobasidium sp. 428]|nr:hypothetical protein FRC12_007275 [Ceratobasidium sp. 428]
MIVHPSSSHECLEYFASIFTGTRAIRSSELVGDFRPQTRPLPATIDLTLPVPILPPELVQDIVFYLAKPLVPPSHAPYNSYREERKAAWRALVGVASSSKFYRDLLVRRWFYVLVVVESSDWSLVRDAHWLNLIEPHVRIIISAKGALTSSPRFQTDTEILSYFGHLTSVSVDYHNDFLRTGGQFPYYQLVRKLPASVQRLEILNAHGPDEQIIKLVSDFCPDLTELRLGRCTMFNNRDCIWWKAHPADHDAYMADRGVEAYAGAVGNLIKNVPKLRVVHIGVYLTPIEAVWAHRVDHRKLHPVVDSMRHENPEGVHNHLHQVALAAANGEDPDPPVNYNYPPLARKEIWEAPCSACENRFRQPAEEAEMRTAAVIAARVWSLRTVSFASFTSPGRVGASAWEVVPRHILTEEELTSDDAEWMLPLLGEQENHLRRIIVDVSRRPDPSEETTKPRRFKFEISWSQGNITVSPPISEPQINTIF